jgi:hypothetical protein
MLYLYLSHQKTCPIEHVITDNPLLFHTTITVTAIYIAVVYQILHSCRKKTEPTVRNHQHTTAFISLLSTFPL